MSRSSNAVRLHKLIGEVKLLAHEYYRLTGRPLGVTAEIAEYEAARILGLNLAPVRQRGYDAIRKTPNGDQLLQVKGRRVPVGGGSQRVGAINLEREWDAVLLILLDEKFDPTAIYEADRPTVTDALQRPGSKARNERGQLSVSQFKAAGRRIWPS
jgi:hypothetical protein